MAINSGAAVVDRGAQTSVITVNALAADTFSGEGDATALVLTDEVVFANAVLDVTVPTLGESGKKIHLYRRDMEVLSGLHGPIPGANYQGVLLGSFLLDATAARQTLSMTSVPISSHAEYYIHNDSGLALLGNTVVYLTPWTWNAKA